MGRVTEKSPPEWWASKVIVDAGLLHISEHGHDKGRLGHKAREHPLQDVILRFKQVGLGRKLPCGGHMFPYFMKAKMATRRAD